MIVCQNKHTELTREQLNQVQPLQQIVNLTTKGVQNVQMIIDLRDPRGRKLAISMTWLYTYKSLILILDIKMISFLLAMNSKNFIFWHKAMIKEIEPMTNSQV